jgi:hypothetical protein
MLEILATWEAEIRRIMFQGQPPGKKVRETPSQQTVVHGGVHLSSQLGSRRRLRGKLAVFLLLVLLRLLWLASQ